MRISYRYNYLVATASGMGGFLFGYGIAVMSQVLTMDSFGGQFGMKNETNDVRIPTPSNESIDLHFGVMNETSLNNTLPTTVESPNIVGWMTFTFLVGCVVGAGGASILADELGRRHSILVGSVFFMIGGAMQAGASHVDVLYIGRTISGIGVGLMSAVVPLYIAETARVNVRGRMVTIYQLMITLGILAAFAVNGAILGTLTGDIEWRLALGMQLIPAGILWGLIIVLPFSPYWLVDRNRDEEALKTLSKLRGLPEKSDILQAEFRSVKAHVKLEKQAGLVTWKELLEPGVRNRVVIGVMLQFFQQWTGINVILYYATGLFGSMGFSVGDSSVTFVIINAAINVLATVPAMWLVERIGRRMLLITGAVIMGCSHFGICLFVGLSEKTPQLAWVAVAFIYVFTIAFASTWGPIVWIYQSEIFPMRCRAKATACCTASNWIWNAIIAKIAPFLFASITFYTYIIFGIFGIIMAIFVAVFVPETKKKTLAEMDLIFGRNNPKILVDESTVLALKAMDDKFKTKVV